MSETTNKEPQDVYQQCEYLDGQWVNLASIKVYDTQSATVNVPKPGEANSVSAINFKITPDDIPVGSTIVGIYVTVRRKANSPNVIYDRSLRIIRTGTAIGDDKASGDWWPTTEALKAYGGPTDLWGITDLTDGEIRERDIGVRLGVSNDDDNPQLCYIDAITMQIYYTPPEATPEPAAVDLSKHIHVP